MDLKFLQAANAYQNQARMVKDQPLDSEAPAAAGQPTFSQMVSSALEEVSGTLHQSEAAKVQALTGKAELSDLVTAVANAELTVSTVVAVRDRVISAYQDIIRMPI